MVEQVILLLFFTTKKRHYNNKMKVSDTFALDLYSNLVPFPQWTSDH